MIIRGKKIRDITCIGKSVRTSDICLGWKQQMYPSIGRYKINQWWSVTIILWATKQKNNINLLRFKMASMQSRFEIRFLITGWGWKRRQRTRTILVFFRSQRGRHLWIAATASAQLYLGTDISLLAHSTFRVAWLEKKALNHALVWIIGTTVVYSPT